MKFKNNFFKKKSKLIKTQKVSLLQGDYKSLYKRYKRGAEKRNLDFKLSEEGFMHLVTSKCTHCGVEPFQVHGKIKYMGIDRRNNNQGYLFDNCSPCCKHCNYAKGTLGYGQFDERLERLAENYILNRKMCEEFNQDFFNKKNISGYDQFLISVGRGDEIRRYCKIKGKFVGGDHLKDLA